MAPSSVEGNDVSFGFPHAISPEQRFTQQKPNTELFTKTVSFII